ncbi:unnamed protein product [Hymenolepis diminuta]|uniref:Uncharacterized protein n=1 Tax=Hymenolepis diminuta TaxID=6216 RepID=A0A564YLW6_HYMDI|nr:unnamed protein product [Hymenolepis diminuta]
MQHLPEEQQALYTAIAQNELTTVLEIIREKSVDFSGDTESTPIIAAVKSRRYRIMALLIKWGVDLSRVDTLGCIALHYAAAYNDRTATLLLCHYGSPTDVKNNAGITPLTLAIAKNHFDIVQSLVDNGATVYPQEDEWKPQSLPLVTASFFGHLNILKYLLNVEATELQKNEHMYYALCAASFTGRLELVEFLIDKGTRFTSSHYNRRSPLVLAIENKHDSIVDILISNGANVNERDREGLTPLMHAVLSDNPYAVSRLLLHDDGCDNCGTTEKRRN